MSGLESALRFSGDAKKLMTSGMRIYGTVRNDSSSSEELCDSFPVHMHARTHTHTHTHTRTHTHTHTHTHRHTDTHRHTHKHIPHTYHT
jgi:hypothetical protein